MDAAITLAERPQDGCRLFDHSEDVHALGVTALRLLMGQDCNDDPDRVRSTQFKTRLRSCLLHIRC